MANRLTDLDHLDELNRMKSRLRLLSVAAESVATTHDDVFSGFHQLIIDVADAMKRCAEAFDVEHGLRHMSTGSDRG